MIGLNREPIKYNVAEFEIPSDPFNTKYATRITKVNGGTIYGLTTFDRDYLLYT